MTDSLNSFIASVPQVPWFRNVSQPLEGQSVRRLDSWKDWTGPQDPKVEAVHLEQQAVREDLERALGTRREELLAVWERVEELVITAAGPVVGYDSSEDTWHAPSAAVWHAAWTACLVAWHVALGRALPRSIAEQWEWFKRGRWPAAFASIDETGRGSGWQVL